MIGRDSNLGFRALGWLQDVNTACADMGEWCLPALAILSRADFVNLPSASKSFIWIREIVMDFVTLVELNIGVVFTRCVYFSACSFYHKSGKNEVEREWDVFVPF